MRFGDPKIFLYLGWVIPAVALFYVWAAAGKRKRLYRFARKGIMEKINPSYSPGLDRARKALSVLAASLMVAALAGPQWGFSWKENRSEGIDILVAVDTSRSMLAADLPPDRLGFTKDRVKRFVRGLSGDRIGLIAFSGQAFLQCPLTSDYGGFQLVLNGIAVGSVPKGGTSIPEAVTEAVRSFREESPDDRMLILITDGENTEGDIDKAIEEAKKGHIAVSCVGIGSDEGSPIPVTGDGGAGYLKDKDGGVVVSRLDETTLQKIAGATGGLYVRATRDDLGLDKIYEKRLSDTGKHEMKEEMRKVYKERFQMFLVVAALALAGGVFLERMR